MAAFAPPIIDAAMSMRPPPFDGPTTHALLTELQTGASAAYSAENWSLCLDFAQRLMAASRAAGALESEVLAHVWTTHVAQRRGEHDSAASHATSALGLAQQLDDPVLLARARLAAARVCWSIGDSDQALQELEAALPACRDSTDAELLFDTLNLLGIVYGELNQAETALEWHQRALALAQRQGQTRLLAISHANLAGRELDLGERWRQAGREAEARDALQRSLSLNEIALEIAQQAHLQRVLIVVHSNRGAALALLGRREEALVAFGQQLRLTEASGDEGPRVQRAQYLAQMYREAGELDMARRAASEGLERGEKARSKHLLIALYELASELAEQAGDYAEALRLYKRFHVLRSEHALDKAQLRARVLAVRLQTEHALAEAAAERLQAHALRLANEELARRAEALGRDALQDPLTGLANRRRLDTELALRHQAARAADLPLCIALIDLDHFKSVNDRHSHAVGDQALRQLAALLQAHCRSQDLAARYGGEEFLIALDAVTPEAALQICERLRLAVERHDWATLAPGLAITTSVGLADLSRHSRLEQGLQEADAQLYRAKREGRNRVCCADGFASPPAA